MKKITDFIVNHRYLVLIFFLILSVISIFNFDKVNINQDITRYLPSSSETRIGNDLMNEEFAKTNSSSLNIMLQDLSSKEKKQALTYLTNLKHITKVEYDNTKKYNKDNYTLYILTVDSQADSKTAHDVYEKIASHFEDSLVDTSGEVSNYNKDVLPFFIIALAVGVAFIILVIMSESYIEPILFLFTIFIAVILNKGSNIIFPSVSNITDSISAILQMALSMDYSIMLMNRYRQEREKTKDKVEAMKKALHHAFASISSSSVTTIVGLLALVFMSFTIGKDLGFVLAKGVLLSLLSIFTCLPGLILMFDTLIIKTKKKSPIIKLHFLGNISHKLRYPALITFILIFIFSYFFKGNLGITYTSSGTDKIDEVFSLNNQMALIYSNKYENLIKNYCHKLEKNTNIDEVLCYSNTINEPLAYNELTAKLKKLSPDTNISIDDDLLKIIYDYYYTKDKKTTITLNDLISFINNNVYNNKNFNSKIDLNTKENINYLSNFVNPNSITLKRTSSDFSNTLNISSDNINDLLIYYQSNQTTSTLTLTEFVNFMNSYVLSNNKYNQSIDSTTKANLNQIAKFNKTTINKPLSSSNMAKLFSLSSNDTKLLYTYYKSTTDIKEKLTLREFTNFLNSNILTNPIYQNQFSSSKQLLELLNNFTNPDIINKKYSAPDLANLLGIDSTSMQQLYFLAFSSQNPSSTTELTIGEFLTKIDYLQKNTPYLANYDLSVLTSLATNEELLNSTIKFTSATLYDFLKSTFQDNLPENISSALLNQLYVLIDFTTNNYQLSPLDFTTIVLSNDAIKNQLNQLDQTIIPKLTTLNALMTNTLNNTPYSYQDLSTFLSLDQSLIKNIYSLYYSDTVNLTPYQFVNYLLKNQNTPQIKNSLNQSTISMLTTLNKIMTSINNNTSYTYHSLATFLNTDENTLKLVYALYDINVKNINVSLSFKEFVSYLLTDIIKNPSFSANFDSATTDKLQIINQIMEDSLNHKALSKEQTYQTLSSLSNNLDKDLIDLLYIYYNSEVNYHNSYTLTIEEFVNFLNKTILNDSRFSSFIDSTMAREIKNSNTTVKDAKKLLTSSKYSRMVLNTNFTPESSKTFNFIKDLKNSVDKKDDIYLIGDSPMAYEMNQTFEKELNFITILTMLFIFIVVLVTFKSILIPIILVLLIQSAVYLTMGILSFSGSVYFISILIVQSILMGATIDYAILYTSYYLETRAKMPIKEAIITSYNNSIHTILTSSSILVIVTYIVGKYASAVAAKICNTLSKGCLCSTILIFFLLPAVLAALDKWIIKNKYEAK